VDTRQQWQALQSRIGEARTALSAGDRARALKALDAALTIDPDYLVAQTMRAQLIGESEAASAPVHSLEQRDPTSPPSPSVVLQPAAPMAMDAYPMLEERARQRRATRRVAAARAAITDGRFDDAEAAINEVRGLDPELPELAAVSTELHRARVPKRRRSWPLAAAAAAALVIGSAYLQYLQTSGTPAFDVPAPVVTLPAAEPDPVPVGVPPEDAGPGEETASDAQFARALVEAETREPDDPAITAAGFEATTGVDDVPAAEPEREPEWKPESLPELAPAVSIPQAELPSAAPETSPAPIPSAVPPPAAARTASPAAANPEPVAVIDDTVLIQQVLQRYRAAYEELDAESAHSVWPAVNERALMRAFSELESQTLTFETCDVQFAGAAANATCRGTTRYVPKVGSRHPRVEARRWSFSLRKLESGWMIENARAER
jgi:hypothetical protein